MADIKWVKRDPDAALVGMAQLTLEQRGAYQTIQDLIYSRDGDLPDDDHLLATHLHVRADRARRLKDELVLAGKLTISSGLIANKRATTELIATRNRITKAKLAAEKRWENNGSGDALAFSGAMTPTPTPTPRKKKESRSTPNGVDREFSQFWEAYPRKVGKKKAYPLFVKALKETSFADLMAALTGQKQGWHEPRYIPHPATWLGQGRWDDEAPSENPAGGLGDGCVR